MQAFLDIFRMNETTQNNCFIQSDYQALCVCSVCVIAGDISPIDVITHLPIMCEDRDIPYVYVPSKEVTIPNAPLFEHGAACWAHYCYQLTCFDRRVEIISASTSYNTANSGPTARDAILTWKIRNNRVGKHCKPCFTAFGTEVGRTSVISV